MATYIIGPRGTEGKITGDQEAPEFRWYITDGLGSVIAEVGAPDVNGNPVKATRRYDVYGAVRSSTGAGAKQQFCGSLGHTADDDIGLTYMRARYYDAAIGGFVSEDPAGDGSNWYAYCENNPVNGIDPTGKFTVGDILTGEAHELYQQLRSYALANGVRGYAEKKMMEVMIRWAVQYEIWYAEAMGFVDEGGYTIAVGATRIMMHLKGHANGEGPHIQMWLEGVGTVGKRFIESL